jgi:plastocyanin domain-containing protein
MTRNRVVLAGIVIASASALAAWGCAQQGASGPQTVKVAVTDRGFEPSEIHIHAGDPVTLLVTRKTDATCAKEIVIADAGVKQELPLNQEVAVTLTPAKKGDLRYACPMGMIAGRLVVQ